MSVPKLYADVERPESIKLAYLNENFEPVEEWFQGMAARMVQHEFSHLEGELFVDRLPPIRKKMIQSKLRAMTRGEVDTFYKTKIVK